MLIPLAAWLLLAAGAEPQISPARIGDDGFLRHEVRCQYQSGTTLIRVLLPDGAGPPHVYPLLLVLPVEPGLEHRYGDGLAEVRRRQLHNRYGLIVAEPTFSQLPWYGDHPYDPQVRQESYLLDVVLPYLRAHYPIGPGRENCLLLGFSKSGWGAWSLLVRHPELFERAATWDAPLAMLAPDKYRMNVVFATPESFRPYCLMTAVARSAGELRGPPRLGLFGYGNFRDQQLAMHQRLVELGIPHAYRDGPPRKHIWESGWVREAVEFLVTGNAAPGATNEKDQENHGGKETQREQK
jgi:hypothetical protein